MKTKTLKWLSLIVIVVLSAGFASCEDDDNNSFIDDPEGNKENISKPTIKKISSAATTTDLDVVFRVSNEGSPSVTLYYGTSENNLSKTRTCRYYQYASKNYDYYKASLTGFNGGTRIYFKGVATNSAGSAETPIYSHIMKR